MDALIKKIKSANSIVLVAHDNPDEDAIGSLVAMQELLLYLHKKVYIFFQTSFNDEYKHFIHNFYTYNNIKHMPRADVVITLDCSARSRIDFNISNLGRCIIAIDHHKNFETFGHINYCEQVDSTTIIINKIAKKIHFKYTDRFATAIYLGIYGDTDGLSRIDIMPDSLQVAAKLLDIYNIDFNIIAIASKMNIRTLQLYGDVLNTIRYDDEYDILYLILDAKKIYDYNITLNAASHIIDLLKRVDCNMIFLFIKNKNKISTRARSTKYDMNQIMSQFGGGGHKAAAGSLNFCENEYIFVNNVLSAAKIVIQAKIDEKI